MAVRIRLTRVGATKQPTYRRRRRRRAQRPRRPLDRDDRALQPAHRAGRVRDRRREGEGVARQGRPAVRHGRPAVPHRGHPAGSQVEGPTWLPRNWSNTSPSRSSTIPTAVTVEVVREDDGDRHRAPRRRGRHGQGDRSQRQRRQGAPDPAQGDRRPRRRAGLSSRSSDASSERLVVALVRGVHGLRRRRPGRGPDRPTRRALRRRRDPLSRGRRRPLTDRSGRGRSPTDRAGGSASARSPTGTAADGLRGAYLEAVVPARARTCRRGVVLLARGHRRDRPRPGRRRELGTVVDVYRVGGDRGLRRRGGPFGEFDVPAVRAFIRIFAPTPGRDRGRRRMRSTCDAGRRHRATPRPGSPEGAAADRTEPGRQGPAAAADPTEPAARRDLTAMTLEIDVLTLFPAMLDGPLADEHPGPDPGARAWRPSGSTTCASGGSVGTARSTTRRTAGERGWSCDPSRSRRPSTPCAGPTRRSILLDPVGEVFRQAPGRRPRRARSHLIFVCPRYEGVDERIRSPGRPRAVDRRLRPDRRRAAGPRRHRRRHPPPAGRDRGGLDRPRSRSPTACSSTRSTRGRRSSAGMDVPAILTSRRPRRGPPLAPARGAATNPERRPDLLAERTATAEDGR